MVNEDPNRLRDVEAFVPLPKGTKIRVTLPFLMPEKLRTRRMLRDPRRFHFVEGLCWFLLFAGTIIIVVAYFVVTP